MKKRENKRSFLVLFLGTLMILLASLFVFWIYLTYRYVEVNRNQLATEFVRVVTLAKALPSEEVKRLMHMLPRRGLRYTVSLKRVRKAIVINKTDKKSLRAFVQQHYPRFIVNIALDNQQWLVIRSVVNQYPWFEAGLWFSAFLLLFALYLLMRWMVQRLALPTADFQEAAKRFGSDVNAPPMALVGSSEVKMVIRAFNEMQAKIRQLMTDRTQMLAAISHDLRTPITRLQLRIEHLKDEKQYEKAAADLKEMEKMIASILSFAKDYASVEAMQRFDINALLESLCDDMVDAGNLVKYSGVDTRLPLLARMTALKRAFTNLIENAIKYGKEAEIVLKKRDGDLQIKISDQGPGIPEQEMEKVFAPFYRADASRSFEVSGSGLGLAVARDIIRAHGGEIALYNREPQGLVVVVDLPLRE